MAKIPGYFDTNTASYKAQHINIDCGVEVLALGFVNFILFRTIVFLTLNIGFMRPSNPRRVTCFIKVYVIIMHLYFMYAAKISIMVLLQYQI